MEKMATNICRASPILSATAVHRNSFSQQLARRSGERISSRKAGYNPAHMAIRVLMYGLGPIGAAVARQVASRKGFQIVGAVDIDREKVGLDLGQVIGLDKKLRVRITNDVAGAIKSGKPDVAVLCTSSSLKTVMPQIETVLKKKVAIVSTTEELSYPVGKNRALARKIDALAKKAKVAVVGTGVNPGFAMDALPIMLTGICERVDSIRVDRIQDARTRRLPFQQKIGAGLNTRQFAQKVNDASVRHVGLAESVTMIADAMGWKLDKVTDDIQPKIAVKAVESELLAVDPGYVSGIIQDGIGYVKGKPRDHPAHGGLPRCARESYDAVTIEGSPRITQRITGGLHGDVATASITVNSIPKILRVTPGLRTMADMPIPSWFRGLITRARRGGTLVPPARYTHPSRTLNTSPWTWTKPLQPSSPTSKNEPASRWRTGGDHQRQRSHQARRDPRHAQDGISGWGTVTPTRWSTRC